MKSQALKSLHEAQLLTEREKYSDLERRLVEVNRQQQITTEELISTKALIRGLEEEKERAVAELSRVRVEVRSKDEVVAEKSRSVAALEEEKRTLLRTCAEMSRDVEKLKAERDDYSIKAATLREQVSELEGQLDELRAKDRRQELRVAQIEKERDLAVTHNKWALAQYTSRSDELYRLGSEKDALEQKCNSQLNEMELLKKQLETLQERSRKAESALLQEQEAARSQKVEHARELASLEDRLVAERRSSQAQSNLNAELKRRKETLEEDLKQAATHLEKLDRELKEEQGRHEVAEAKLAESTRRVSELEENNAQLRAALTKETEERKLAIEQLEALHKEPSNEAQRQAAQTELYLRYLAVTEQLENERREKLRAEDFLLQIQREIEVRAPYLRDQQIEHERMKRMYEDMSSRYNATVEEANHIHERARELEKQNIALVEAVQKLERLRNDLGTQVRHLLKKNEHQGEDSDDSSAVGFYDPQALISARLVRVANVDELQKRNVELLAVVRDLTEHNEQLQVEKKQQDEKLAAEVKRELQAAHEKLEEMKAAREAEQAQLHAITEQFELFKQIVRTDNAVNAVMDRVSGQGAGQRGPLRIAGSADESAVVVAQDSRLKERFDELSKSYDEARATADRKDKELQAVRLELVTCQGNLNFYTSRVKALEEQVAQEKKSIAILEKSLSEARAADGRKQQEINELGRKLADLQSKFQVVSGELAAAKAERDIAKENEANSAESLEALRRQLSTQERALETLKNLQSSLDQSAHEGRRKLAEERDRLQGEVKALAFSAEEIRKQADLERSMKTKEIEELRERLSLSERNCSELKQQLASSKTALEAEKEKFEELKRQFNRAQDQIDKFVSLRSNAGSDSVAEAERKAQLEIKNLSDELNRKEQEIARKESEFKELKNMATRDSKLLVEMTNMFQESKSNLLDSEAKRVQLVQRIEEQANHLNSRDREILQLTTAAEDLQRTVQRLEREKEAIEKRVDARARHFEELEKVLQADLQRQRELTKEAHSDYSRELENHAKTRRLLQDHEMNVSGIERKLEEALAEAKALRERAEAFEVSWHRQKALLEKDLKEQKQRNADLLSVNTQLLEQVEAVSSQNRRVLEGSSDSTNPTSAQLLALLRVEKEAAEANLVTTRLEMDRMQAELRATKQALDEAQTQVRAVRSAAQPVSQGEYEALKARIQSLNNLEESNLFLRQELQRVEASVRDARAKAAEAQAQLEPLQQTVELQLSKISQLEGEAKALEEERDRWRNRVHHVLDKNQQVDPEVHKSVVAELDRCRGEKKELEEQLRKLQEEKKHLDDRVENLRGIGQQLKQRAMDAEKALNELRLQRSSDSNNQIQQLHSSHQAEQVLLRERAQNAETRVKRAVNLLQRSAIVLRRSRQTVTETTEECNRLEDEVNQATESNEHLQESMVATNEQLQKIQQDSRVFQDTMVAQLKQTQELSELASGYRKEIQELKNQLARFEAAASVAPSEVKSVPTQPSLSSLSVEAETVKPPPSAPSVTVDEKSLMPPPPIPPANKRQLDEGAHVTSDRAASPPSEVATLKRSRVEAERKSPELMREMEPSSINTLSSSTQAVHSESLQTEHAVAQPESLETAEHAPSSMFAEGEGETATMSLSTWQDSNTLAQETHDASMQFAHDALDVPASPVVEAGEPHVTEEATAEDHPMESPEGPKKQEQSVQEQQGHQAEDGSGAQPEQPQEQAENAEEVAAAPPAEDQAEAEAQEEGDGEGEDDEGFSQQGDTQNATEDPSQRHQDESAQ